MMHISDNPHLQKEFMQFIHTCVSHDNPQQYRILRQKLLVVRGMVQVPVSMKEDVETPPLKVSVYLGMVSGRYYVGCFVVIVNPGNLSKHLGNLARHS